MEKEKGHEFVSLLQDETFIIRVKSTLENKNQLEILEKEYPGQRETLAQAVDFIRVNLSDKKRMPQSDVNSIWKNIKKYAESEGRGKTISLFNYRLWKVAAAAIIILVLAGSVFVYQKYENDPLRTIASIDAEITDEAVIVLSDGSKHKLDVNESKIEYRSGGGEVVVKKDNQEEKIENDNSSAAVNINQIIVPYGRKHTLVLSDGTQVTLNSGSRLVFPAEFREKKREVFLSGEGYFEVAKNSDKPFIVKTDFLAIKVLGTIFNVTSYKEEQIISAVLVEGKVAVSQNNNFFDSKEDQLSPGQGYFYSSATGSSGIRSVDVNEYISWKDGLLLFKDKSLINIVNKVEKYYNQKINIEGEKLANTLISGKLVLSDGIGEVAEYLSKTIEGSYEENIDGTIVIKN